MVKPASTCCCLLTPPGTGAIAVIRLVGPDASRIIEAVFAPGTPPPPLHVEATNHGKTAKRGWTADSAMRIRYGHVVDDDGVLDDAVVSFAPTPDGPAFDLCVHGGVRIVERTLAFLQRQGATLAPALLTAWPARTRIEQEALSALSVAKTPRAVHWLAWQRTHLVHHLRDLAARATRDHATVRMAWHELIAVSEAALPLVTGATVALVGLPNSGKSTVFNRLVGRQTAVAAPLPGTTRDWVSAEIDLRGVAVTLIDTAGRRSSTDSLEDEAITRGRMLAQSADAVVVIVDGTVPMDDAVAGVVDGIPTNQRLIVAVNKIDLPQRLNFAKLTRVGADSIRPALSVSALQGTGIEKLGDVIVKCLGVHEASADRRPAFFSARQLDVARSLTPRLESKPADFARQLFLCFIDEATIARPV